MKSVKKQWRFPRQIKWRQGLLGAVTLIMFVFLITGRNHPKISTSRLEISDYKNMKLEIPSVEMPESIQISKMAEQLLDTGENGDSLENLEQFLRKGFQEEVLYEEWYLKRQAVLEQLLENTTWKVSVKDPELEVLLAVYEEAGLEVSETELEQGKKLLMSVFGVETEEALQCYLSTEAQINVIKKEKAYEYLLENNTFLVDPSLSVKG